MKIVICGPAIDESMEKKLYGASPAAGRFLKNMIKALNNNGYKTVKAIYVSYPVRDKSVYTDIPESEDIYYFKDSGILNSIINFRKDLLKKTKCGDIIVFYNMSYVYFGLTKKIIKKGAFPVLILADHTGYHEEVRIEKKVLAYLYEKEFKKFESVISLADYDQDRFSKSAKIEIMRGGINFDYFQNISAPHYDEKITIMYAGLLSKVTGVDVLLKAMEFIPNKNIVLLVSGKGDLEETVKVAEKYDSRIHYLGFMNSEDYYNTLNKVNIFVNPRNMKLAQNRNNFPSKILEYIATGRCIISTPFSGKSEFENLIEWYEGEHRELAEKIIEVIGRYPDIYQETYNRNRRAAKNYDWNVQALKIICAASSGV